MDSNNLKKYNSKVEISSTPVSPMISNPIDKPKIMPLNARTSSNRLFSGYTNSFNNKTYDINYPDIINALNTAFVNQTDSAHLFYSIHNQICSKFNLNFSALGTYNQNSNYINLKLIDKTNTSYNSKIMLSDTENVVVKAFQNKQVILTTDSEYLKLNYLTNAPTHIIPLLAFNECEGVMIFSDSNGNQDGNEQWNRYTVGGKIPETGDGKRSYFWNRYQ